MALKNALLSSDGLNKCFTYLIKSFKGLSLTELVNVSFKDKKQQKLKHD